VLADKLIEGQDGEVEGEDGGSEARAESAEQLRRDAVGYFKRAAKMGHVVAQTTLVACFLKG